MAASYARVGVAGGGVLLFAVAAHLARQRRAAAAVSAHAVAASAGAPSTTSSATTAASAGSTSSSSSSSSSSLSSVRSRGSSMDIGDIASVQALVVSRIAQRIAPGEALPAYIARLPLAGPDSAQILKQCIAETLRRDEESFMIRPVNGTEGAKGHTGDAVSLILDPSTKKLIAVAKVFNKVTTFELELSAMAHLARILHGSKLCDVPTALGAQYAALPHDRVGGVLIMSPAAGVALDDIIVEIGNLPSDSAQRAAVCDRMRKGVEASARGLADLHNRSRCRGVAVTRAYLTAYVTQNNHLLDQLDIWWKDHDLKAQVAKLGTTLDLAVVRDTLNRLTEKFLENPGDAVVAHGDAHIGNVFWQEDTDCVTFIDVPTAIQSISSSGAGTGCSARDSVNFLHKLASHGMRLRLKWREVSLLRNAFSEAYVAAGGELDGVACGFFHIRCALGEVMRAVKRDRNLRKGMVEYLNASVHDGRVVLFGADA